MMPAQQSFVACVAFPSYMRNCHFIARLKLELSMGILLYLLKDDITEAFVDGSLARHKAFIRRFSEWSGTQEMLQNIRITLWKQNSADLATRANKYDWSLLCDESPNRCDVVVTVCLLKWETPVVLCVVGDVSSRSFFLSFHIFEQAWKGDLSWCYMRSTCFLVPCSFVQGKWRRLKLTVPF